MKRENLIGVSNKNFDELGKYIVTPAENDVTNKWKIVEISTDKNVIEYIKSYYDKNFKNINTTDTEENHIIINLKTMTEFRVGKVTQIFLDVTCHRYHRTNKHDAKLLCGGKVLKHYFIYLDNGDIEEIEVESV